MKTAHQVTIGLLSVLTLTSATPLSRRQDDNSTVRQLVAIPINNLTLPDISSISYPDLGPGLSLDEIKPDPWEPSFSFAGIKYRFKFDNYRFDIPADSIYKSLRQTLRDPVYRTEDPTKPVGAPFELKGKGWFIDIDAKWRQKQDITYGDQFTILYGIYNFTDAYSKAGETRMPIFDLMVTKNPGKAGAPTTKPIVYFSYSATSLNETLGEKATFFGAPA